MVSNRTVRWLLPGVLVPCLLAAGCSDGSGDGEPDAGDAGQASAAVGISDSSGTFGGQVTILSN